MKNLIVTDWFTVRSNYIIRGKIDTSSNVYYIEEIDTTINTTGKSRNLRIAKERIRFLLLEYGCNIDNEIRHTNP